LVEQGRQIVDALNIGRTEYFSRVRTRLPPAPSSGPVEDGIESEVMIQFAREECILTMTRIVVIGRGATVREIAVWW
jgi:hypothetical protein